ncbi:MAG: hypothetical protein AAGG68_16730 [Bacteroidota bacterium]
MLNFIKRLKLSYQLYNFFKQKELAHNLPLYQKYGLKKKYFSSISSKDFKHLEGEVNIHDIKDSAEELPKNEAFQKLDTTTQKALKTWSKNGYVILENS